MTCPTVCHYTLAALLAAWVMWFPWAFTGSREPRWAYCLFTLVSALLVGGACVVVLFVMPTVCEAP